MIRIPGGTFRMGSDKHYPEEAPSHRVTVDPFWIDATPVTNAQFRAFVQATGYVTWAEIDPDPKDYPGAQPEDAEGRRAGLHAAAKPVDLRDWSQWWRFTFGATWRRPYGKGSHIGGLDDHPVVQIAYEDAEAYANGPARSCRPRPSGSSPRAAGWRRRVRLGRRIHAGGKHMANTWQGTFPLENLTAPTASRGPPR